MFEVHVAVALEKMLPAPSHFVSLQYMKTLVDGERLLEGIGASIGIRIAPLHVVRHICGTVCANLRKQGRIVNIRIITHKLPQQFLRRHQQYPGVGGWMDCTLRMPKAVQQTAHIINFIMINTSNTSLPIRTVSFVDVCAQ